MSGPLPSRPRGVPLCLAAASVVALSVLPRGVRGLGHCTNESYKAFGHWPQELDYGIWWWGKNQAKEKAVKGQASSLFDPSKKTVVYIHGWSGHQGGFSKACARPTTACSEAICGDDRDLFTDWFDNGWNIGFFYWDQFGDEPCARDAEQKIWFDRSENGMRYSTYNFDENKRRYEPFWRVGMSVAELCVESVNDAMDGFYGEEFRLVGHSLGTQLATRCASLLHGDGNKKAVAPTRVVLLDPFFTKYHFNHFRCHAFRENEGIGEFSLKQVTGYIKTLYDNGIPTTVHMSSPFPEDSLLGDTVFPFEPIVLLVKHMIQWCGKTDSLHPHNMGCAHNAAEVVYFYRVGAGKDAPECLPALPLSCTDRELWEMQTEMLSGAVHGKQRTWFQTTGRDTRDSSDDEYRMLDIKMNAREKLAFVEANAHPLDRDPLAAGGASGYRAHIAAAVGLVAICATVVVGAKLRRTSKRARPLIPVAAASAEERGRLVPAE